MMRSLWLFALLAAASAKDLSRWSRQISSYTSDLTDWVPLPGPVKEPQGPTPIKRQAVAEPRILSEPVFHGPIRQGFNDFPPRNFYNAPSNRMYLQSVPSVPSAPQNYLSDSGFGQTIRFGLSQPNLPLTQGFLSPSLSQQFPFDNAQQILKQRPVANPIKFENFPNANLPTISTQAKPFLSQPIPQPPKNEGPKYVDGYQVEGNTGAPKKPQSLQKLKFESFENVPKTEMVPPPGKAKSQREEVQLLYVPLESLNRGEFNFRSPLTTQVLSGSSQEDANVKHIYQGDFSRPAVRPIENFDTDQDFYSNYNVYKQFDQAPKFSTLSSPFPTTVTTPKPRKLKPHQPPLAIFMTRDARKSNPVKVGDVLSTLKNAATVAVLDAVNPQTAPNVFIGPSSLNPPENFVKFELPYLSNIEHSDKKLRQLPFFVAPLSYNTPQGFAKIPFPSPHVGSVVINSQISQVKDTLPPITPPPTKPTIPPYSTVPETYQSNQRPGTQKPTINYYTTSSPRTNPPALQQNYYSLEPQTVSTLRPSQPPQVTPPRPGLYSQNTGLYSQNNAGSYNPSNIRFEPQAPAPVPVQLNRAKLPENLSTPKPVVSTTPGRISTYPSELLQTHNPYSINQAFSGLSSPLDYQTFFEEPNPAITPPPTELALPASKTPKPSRQPQKSTPLYQNYSPEIHYETEIHNSRFQNRVNANEHTSKPEVTSNYSPSVSDANTNYAQTVSSTKPSFEYDFQSQEQLKNVEEALLKDQQPIVGTEYSLDTNSSYYQPSSEPSSTTTSTTTPSTTRRAPLRGKGRPRYTTTPRSDSSHESTSKPATRKPLRERRPLPTRAPLPARSRYEPNKIATERATRKPVDSNESTTKYTRSRTRGRVHYKPSDSDEVRARPSRNQGKEDDLAYQRDILHQNYPVTLMERTSTVDIEAITEPAPKLSSTQHVVTSEYFDTENADTNDKVLISHIVPSTANKEDAIPESTKQNSQTDSLYVPKVPAEDEYTYQQSRSSFAPFDASSYDETFHDDQGGEPTGKGTTPIQRTEEPKSPEPTEPTSIITEQNIQTHPNTELSTAKQEEATTITNIDLAKTNKPESVEVEQEENVVQTTPSYNRVRVRPGVIRQYHQASSTESSKTKTDRRRPSQPVTYRPAFDRRRTTMRIEEIGEDLKTKQVHARPESQDHRHPVYKPEPSTEGSLPSTETSTKRGVFRRRRPAYQPSTTSTEASSTRRTYELKNRFRGRRPAEKTTEKAEVQTEAPVSRSTHYTRHSNRPKLSERFNKKPETEESDDQETHYSINRPKYVEPEPDQWSPKISGDSFKPYNPNDIVDDTKPTTGYHTETEGDNESEIITARNEYEDVLISVTPPSNNRSKKKIPDIPPTLEALVEQSKNTKSEAGDSMSNFESMLEQVMKSLEEQDEDEYTTNVMKHKGGEIGEIPPERIISSEDYTQRTTFAETPKATTLDPVTEEAAETEEPKGRRRGFWKKVKVRPVTESIETAESQYYPNSVNRNIITLSKTVADKSGKYEITKATTYKPDFQTMKDIFGLGDNVSKEDTKVSDPPKSEVTTENYDTEMQTDASPGDMDLGTGAPDPTIMDVMYQTTPTEASVQTTSFLDRSDAFSLMDYLFGANKNEDDEEGSKKETEKAVETPKTTEKVIIDITTEKTTPKLATTETTFIPDEITIQPFSESAETLVTEFEIKKVTTEKPKKVTESKKELKIEKIVKPETTTTTESSFMDPLNVMSTSMSTEISHETEICFRGKCIKTSKDIL